MKCTSRTWAGSPLNVVNYHSSKCAGIREYDLPPITNSCCLSVTGSPVDVGDQRERKSWAQDRPRLRASGSAEAARRVRGSHRGRRGSPSRRGRVVRAEVRCTARGRRSASSRCAGAWVVSDGVLIVLPRCRRGWAVRSCARRQGGLASAVAMVRRCRRRTCRARCGPAGRFRRGGGTSRGRRRGRSSGAPRRAGRRRLAW